MKRAFDIAAAACALIVLAPVLAVIAVIVRLETPGPAIHWSRRAGRNGALFAMPKFRTMRIDTPDVATHLLENPAQWVTPAGRVLRKTSLAALINRSINETLSRTLLTTSTSLMVLFALFFFGGGVIHGFAFTLIVGLIAGTYSSIFIASPVVEMWKRDKS